MKEKHIKTEGYSHAKADARKALRGAQAIFRQTKYDSLSVASKIAVVRSRGGSKRELARLLAA